MKSLQTGFQNKFAKFPPKNFYTGSRMRRSIMRLLLIHYVVQIKNKMCPTNKPSKTQTEIIVRKAHRSKIYSNLL